MNFRFLFSIIFLFFCAGLIAAKNPGNIVFDSFEETAGKGLEIRTNPSSARVFINGVERGFTPLVLDSLQAGEYSIRLVKDGYSDREFDVSLFNNSRLVVSIKMEQPSWPVPLTISKAGGSPEDLPFTPFISGFNNTSMTLTDAGDYVTTFNLNEGSHTIIARAFGWEDAAVTALVNEDTAPVNIIMRPAEFKIENLTQSNRKFNPRALGYKSRIFYAFHVSAPGTGAITIQNENGEVVLKKELGPFSSWSQGFIWDGKDDDGNHLPQGNYSVLIEAQDQQLNAETEIDFSYTFFPLAFTSGMGGLIFSPLPYTLPAGSFQISASASYGRFNSFTGFPFEIGLRISPVNKLETTAFFNINPQSKDTGWGVSGSAKYNFVNSHIIAFSAGAFYSWASDNGESPLGSGKGVGVNLPFSLEFGPGSFVFSPGVFWHGPEGLTPVLLLSAGIRYSRFTMDAGLSARYEIDFKQINSSKLFAGAEVYMYPSYYYSNLYFSLQGGMWKQDSSIGGYGGLGIGLIY